MLEVAGQRPRLRLGLRGDLPHHDGRELLLTFAERGMVGVVSLRLMFTPGHLCRPAPEVARRWPEILERKAGSSGEPGLARFKQPDRLVVADDLPLTAAGEIDKPAPAARLG